VRGGEGVKRKPTMTYPEVLEELRKCKTAKDARRVHKLLKEHGRGHGLPLSTRYPYLAVIVSGISLALSIIALIVKIILA
jgi:hypothetical protein